MPDAEDKAPCSSLACWDGFRTICRIIVGASSLTSNPEIATQCQILAVRKDHTATSHFMGLTKAPSCFRLIKEDTL